MLLSQKVLPKLCCDTRARMLLCKWVRTRDGELPAHVRNLCYALLGLKVHLSCLTAWFWLCLIKVKVVELNLLIKRINLILFDLII